MEREAGAGIGMGNTCKPMADSFQCMTKFTTNNKKKIRLNMTEESGSSLQHNEDAKSLSPPKLDCSLLTHSHTQYTARAAQGLTRFAA